MHCSFQYFVRFGDCRGCRLYLLRPSMGPSIAISLSVCVSCLSLEPLDQSSRNFVCRSPVAVARSSTGGVAIRYVLPVYG